MGPLTFRTYHEVTGDDHSRLGEQVARQRRRVQERLRSIARLVAVVSGKGGVGKSYVTAGLALGMADRLAGGVGVLDADLQSPIVARMLDAHGPLRVDADGVHPARGCGGVRVISTDLLLEEGSPLAWRQPSTERFVWRSVLDTGALREFLGDVVWGPLDLLLVDMPPDSSRLEDLAELVPGLTGAVAVTIPSEESRRSVERAMQCAADARVPLLGVVENMSSYECAQCGTARPLFDGHAGARLAADFGVPLLGRVPFSARGLTSGPSAALNVVVAAFREVLP
jgi:ATP-binding protein involved in chromosome partitioning